MCIPFIYTCSLVIEHLNCRINNWYHLQAWVYEHFLFVRPPAHWGYTAGMPLASRWNPGKDSGIPRENTQLLRERLDDLHASEVSTQ